MPATRVLLLGATGRLGRAVRAAAAGDASLAVEVPGRSELDLAALSVEGWADALRARAPAVVFNCAAYAIVDACETDRAGAEAVNAVGPGRLAEACAQVGAGLLHVSTDYVFGDVPGPFAEDAPVGPVQHYGVTKAAGEAAILATEARAAIARVSWLFGPTSPAFSDYVLGQVDGSGGPVRVHSRQASRPTPTVLLAPWLLGVVRLLAVAVDVPRILHPGGGDWADRGEWARAILDAAGHSDIGVMDQGEDGRMLAVRPLDSRLDSTSTLRWASAQGLGPSIDWRPFVGAATGP